MAQEAGDLVAVVATGSTHGSRHRRWLTALVEASLVLVAYDEDDAGEHAARWWLERIPSARRLVPDGDAAGMLESGRDVRRWVREAVG